MTDQLEIQLDGQLVPVRVRKNAQARRMVLRVCPTSGEIRLTMPRRARLGAARKFLLDHVSWIEEQRSKAASVPTVGHGHDLLFCGRPHQLSFTGEPPRKVLLEGGALYVGGPSEMAPKRLLNWLKAEAKSRLEVACQTHAGTLGVDYSRISIGDMKSRWGSCSNRGTLRFNWRLVMAPEAVLDYVAAHEVAHLLEMNHSDRFWEHVARCDSAYQDNRRWLKRNGGTLFAVKF